MHYSDTMVATATRPLDGNMRHCYKLHYKNGVDKGIKLFTARVRHCTQCRGKLLPYNTKFHYKNSAELAAPHRSGYFTGHRDYNANKAFRHVEILYKNLLTIYIVKEINACFTHKFL